MNAQNPAQIQMQAEGPQPLVREIPKGAPYPVAALGPLQEAVRAVQGMTLAPIAIPAASALAVASLSVQGFVDVETLNGQSPVSLYLLTIAASGERKSSCDAPLMAGLRAFEKEEGKLQREDMAVWENADAIWKCERDRILNEARKAKGEKKTAAEADLRALGRQPAPPSSPDRTVSEPTFEGLTRKFAEGMPTLGIFSDEGGQFLGGFAMSRDNRQKTFAALNDLWHGNAIRRTRAGEGSLTLFNRRLAVHLMVQPGVARNFMADPLAGDTGFLPRFLMCEPPSTIGTRLQSQMHANPAAINAFEDRLRAILETPLPMDLETRELVPRVLLLSSGAREMLAAYSDDVEAEQAPGGSFANVTGYASKSAEQAARIAGVLTAWRDLNATVVTAETMADAITLASYYLTEAVRLADAATVSAGIERAEALRVWLLDRWEHAEILPSEIVRHAPIRALRESPAVKAAIATLEQHGWLVALPEGKFIRGALRKVAWQIVGKRHEI
jgi:hypothetical protein